MKKLKAWGDGCSCRPFCLASLRHLLVATTAALGLWGIPSESMAHAARTSLTTTTFLFVSPSIDVIDATYTVAFGDVPARAQRAEMDRNDDGRISQDEKQWYSGVLQERLDRCLRFQIGNSPASTTWTPVEVRPDNDRVEPVWLRLQYQITLESSASSPNPVRFVDGCQLPARGLSEVRIEAPPGVILGDVLPATHEEDGVYSYRLDGNEISTITFSFSQSGTPVERLSQPSGPQIEVPPTHELAQVLRNHQILTIWAFLFAFFLGAAHALTPGHGKTLVAAYLVGRRGTAVQALLLGLVVTLTHVSSVVVLGLVALWASETLLPSSLSTLMSIASGGLIVLLGFQMIRRRLGAWLESREHEHEHEQGHGHGHGQGQGGESERGLWGILLLGVSGGMVPCPSALVVLLLAIAVGRIVEGMLLIAAFSLGLASVLVLLGVLVVKAQNLLDRILPRPERLALLPLVSAVIITIIGVVVVIQAVLYAQ